MGRRFRLSFNRTAMALALTAIALAVPCGAWFVAGSRELDREMRLEEKGLYHQAQEGISKLANRLADRLEALRRAESRRPFYHYQNLYHDPKGAAEGASVSISPLANGPADPWIKAHFQIDADGRLTLPTINDQFPDLGLPDDSSQCALLLELEEIALLCASQGDKTCNEDLAALPFQEQGSVQNAVDGERKHREKLTQRAWWQHLQASVLYADLKYGRRAHASDPESFRQRANTPPSPIIITVGAFTWHTLPVDDRPALVALRDVETPDGHWTQGFLVAIESVLEGLQDAAPLQATFLPQDDPFAERRKARLIETAVEGTPWAVGLDLSAPLSEISAHGAGKRQRFLRFFLFGTLAASLAGLLVVVLVYQSERLAEQRARFAASAAHELRTPLAGLRLYGEMLAEGLGDPSRSADYARRMASEAERLGRVVTNVLSFTRLERQSVNIKPQLGNLALAVSEAVAEQRPALEEAGAVVDVEVGSALPPVRFDRDALTHILQNLLDNAEKYTRDVDQRRISVRLVERARDVVLSVADNGHGVGKSLRRHLFRPFSRGHQPDAPEGLGLGLVLVKALVDAQGGTISYQDAPSGGAVFNVVFPI